MSTTDFYYLALAASCLMAFSNWRQAIYLAILLDFVRDPVRKLDPAQSVFITVSVLGLWAAITIAAYGQSRLAMVEAKQQHPKIFQALRLMVYAIIPGAMISMLLYSAGYKMVLLGAVSYLAPAAGIMLGYLLGSDEKTITKILQFYCIVNGLALTSVIAEYMGLGWPLLGGLRGMVWIRYSGHDIVDLIGGFYRSPDIMGLHAAQVVMFALTLSMQKQRSWSPVWIAFALLGSLCLLLSGRRKMLGMPMVFMASLLLFSYRRGIQNYQLKVIPLLAILGIVGGLYLISTETYVGAEYTNYASTLFSDGAERYRALVGDSVVTTVAQSGVLGGGLGSATQGAYHFVGNQKGSWQEDGVSRVFRELGVIGVLLVLAAGWALVQGIVSAVRRTPKQLRTATLQLCLLSIVLANLASFSISHQQYSGDPPSALFVLIMLGMALAISPALVLARSSNAQPNGGFGRTVRPVAESHYDE